MKKTLGGDRLGSGKKMQVDLHGYERSTHDLGYLWRSTMSAGTLVPFMVEVALPGDTFDIHLDADIKTHPTIGPLFGSYKVQLDVFQCPIRLYQAQLHNNKLGIGNNMSSIKFPIMKLTAQPTNSVTTLDIDNAQINPSCIFSYLGIRGVGIIDSAEPTAITRDFNALSFLMYWDIYKNYYANKQEEQGAVIHGANQALVETMSAVVVNPGANIINQAPLTGGMFLTNGAQTITLDYTGAAVIPEQIIFKIITGGVTKQVNFTDLVSSITHVAGDNMYGPFNFSKWGPTTIVNWDYISITDTPAIAPVVHFFDLANLDQMRENILAEIANPNAFVVSDQALTPYSWAIDLDEERNPMLNTQEGLAIKTYQSDLFNNWLNTEWIAGSTGINEISSVSTVGDSFTIDSLQLAKKVYDMLNRIAVSGGTYDDWLDAVYTHDRYIRTETPVYHGGLIKELVFQEVVSNAQSAGDEAPTQPLGTLAGKGIMGKKHKGGKVYIKVDEPAMIIGIISLTPRIDYSQGNKWHNHLLTMDDLHKPPMDGIGFQELSMEQMAWWTTEKPLAGNFTSKSIGYQPAWINYMTNVNQTLGNFAIPTNEMFMTLNRRFEWDGTSEMNDATTYIDPVKFNNIFANTALDAQNFWAQIAVDITARRKMSHKIMPNL